MTNKITDEDIQWFERQVELQKDPGYKKMTSMELKLAKAVKELQEKQSGD